MTTYRDVATTLIELGMVSPARAEEVLARTDDVTVDRADLPMVLEDFRVAISLDFESGKCGYGIDAHEDGYREWLEWAAGTAGGALTIRDVVLIEDGDGYAYLHFLANDRTCWWEVEREFDEMKYLDMMPILQYLDDYEPGGDDPRHFHEIVLDGANTDYYVLVSDEQGRALARTYEFGLRGLSDPPETPTSEPAAPPTSLATWLAETEEAWRAVRAELPDWSPDRIEALERLLLDRFPAEVPFEAIGDDHPFLNGWSRCLGEELRRITPSHWTVSNQFGRYVLTGEGVPYAFGAQESPGRLIWLLVTDRRPGFLRGESDHFRAAYDRYQLFTAEAADRLAARR